MVAPIYSNKKGIYKDLYREIDADNKKKEASQAPKPKKGIYVNLYRQLEEDKILHFKSEEEKNNLSLQLIQTAGNGINKILSQWSYFFSNAASKLKLLIIACIVVKKPINNYIENNLPIYLNQGLNQGIYYND